MIQRTRYPFSATAFVRLFTVDIASPITFMVHVVNEELTFSHSLSIKQASFSAVF